MPLSRMLPSVAIVLVAQAVLDAGPAIVAEREGGMGLGSALIGALVTRTGGVILGATVAGHLVDRSSAEVALLGGAFLTYVGLLAVGIAPMGSLATVMVGMGVAGIGFGGMLTAVFSLAARLESPGYRAAAIVFLLVVPIGARGAADFAFAAGTGAFLVGGATIVALAVLAARLPRATGQRVQPPGGGADIRARTVAGAMLSGVFLPLGAMLAVAGADPSRLSASLIAGAMGMGGLETIDAARGVMLGLGTVLLLIGGAALLSGVDRRRRIAIPGLLLIGLSGSGISAALTQAMTAGRMPDATTTLIGVAMLVGGALGLATGGALVARGRGHRVPAIIGGALLSATGAMGLVALFGQRPETGDPTPIILVAVAGIGLGVAAAALRLALTDVDPNRRGVAAGAGVAAALVGSALGGLIGAGEGLSTLAGEARSFPFGMTGFVVAAAAAAGLAIALPDTRGRGGIGPDDGGRLRPPFG